MVYCKSRPCTRTSINVIRIRPLGRRLCIAGEELITVRGQYKLVAIGSGLGISIEEYHAHAQLSVFSCFLMENES